MKTISKFILAILLVSFITVACDDVNSIIQDDLNKGEEIYLGRANSRDTSVYAGIGKVKLYWNLGSDSRVTKSVITYTFNGETKTKEKPLPVPENENDYIYQDSLVWDGLAEGYYSFSVYTVDDNGHHSITSMLYPQNVRVYGRTYLSTLSPRGIEKMEMLAGGKLQVTWSKDTTNVLYSVIEYKDYNSIPDEESKSDTVSNKTETIVLPGFKRFENFKVISSLQVGIDVVDTINTFYAPPLIEKVLLVDNGFTQLTAENAERIESLTIPVGMNWTFKDLYYFPNLTTLDLTPGTTDTPLSEWKYDKSYVRKTGVDEIGYDKYDTVKFASTIGGIPWLHFVSGYIPKSDIDIIDSLFASGPLTTVKYTRNSYPGLDAILRKYSDSKTITWVPDNEPSDDDVMIKDNLLVDYRVVDRTKGVNIDGYVGSQALFYDENYVYVTDSVKGKFPTTGTLKNVYKVEIKARPLDNPDEKNVTAGTTIAFAIPAGLQLGNVRLKFDSYIESQDYTWLQPAGISRYEGWKKVKVAISRKLSDAFPDDSPYVVGDFPFDASYRAETLEYGPDNDKGFNVDPGKWASHEWDLTGFSPGHYRVIRIQFGADGAPWGLPAGKTLTYYIANLRLTTN